MSYTPPGYPPVSGEEQQRQQYQQYQQYQQQYPHVPTPPASGHHPAGPPPYFPSPSPQGGYQDAPKYNPPPGSPYDHAQSSYPPPPGPPPNAQAHQTPPGVYAPGPPRDPKPPPPTGFAAFTAKLKHIAPGESTEALLNPPPPSFLREPAPNMSYAPFEPTALVGPSERLDKGFGVEVPPWAPGKGPHPFSTHDVREEDWERFLSDLKKAAALTGRDKVVAGVVPMAAGIGIAGMFISRAMEGRMRTRKRGPAGEFVDHWNHYFFNPRRITITLAQGAVSFSGQSDGPPPDVLGGQYHPPPDAYYEDDAQYGAGSSAPPQDLSRRERRGMRREERHAARGTRREERQQERQRGREERQVRDDNWRLVISPA